MEGTEPVIEDLLEVLIAGWCKFLDDLCLQLLVVLVFECCLCGGGGFLDVWLLDLGVSEEKIFAGVWDFLNLRVVALVLVSRVANVALFSFESILVPMLT